MSARPRTFEPTPEAPLEESAPVVVHGWNAYDVWRTRVLMPGIKSAMPAKKKPTAASESSTD
jgi:hypothetical protein